MASPAQQSVHAKLRELAASQAGVVSRRQALHLGMSSAAVSRRLSSGEWLPLLPGVYRFAATPETSTSWTHAAVMWAGPGAALSHRSALEAWGFRQPFDLLEVVTTHRREAREDLKVHQVVRLDPAHVVLVNGVRVTTPER